MPPYGPNVMRFHEGGPDIVHGLFFLVFLTAVVVLGVWLIASVLRPRGRFAHHDHAAQVAGRGAAGAWPDALGILDERFARGEIDSDDYKARRELLVQSKAP
ncbi:MAG TPA: SHOCT domain-containing protein [Acidimicrobiales bacterium]|nr:SHOCT domain-containing protein [Acidimicrobiales bacterium]